MRLKASYLGECILLMGVRKSFPQTKQNLAEIKGWGRAKEV